MIVLSYMDTKIENPLVIDTTNTVKKDEKVFEQNNKTGEGEGDEKKEGEDKKGEGKDDNGDDVNVLSGDNKVDVDITPDVKSNDVYLQLCSCSMVFNCFTSDSTAKNSD